MPDGPVCSHCMNRVEYCLCPGDDGVFMPKPVHPPESWQQGYMEGKAEAQKTLRDEFAMTALPSGINEAHADRAWEHGDKWQMHIAIQAYRWADAMLAAREEGDE